MTTTLTLYVSDLQAYGDNRGTMRVEMRLDAYRQVPAAILDLFRSLDDHGRELVLGDLIPLSKETAQAARDIIADVPL